MKKRSQAEVRTRVRAREIEKKWDEVLKHIFESEGWEVIETPNEKNATSREFRRKVTDPPILAPS